MTFVVFGAGAIGGVVGARLHQYGHDVVLVARGPHLDAIRRNGLTLLGPDDEVLNQPIPTVGSPAEVQWEQESIVLLATKSQHTAAALADLARDAPPSVPIVCLQNGVENERLALRSFSNVHGALVICPAVHLQPGTVEANSAPVTGIIDIGRYPAGRNAVDDHVAAALSASTFSSTACDRIMRWKWCKLIANARATIEVVLEPSADRAHIDDLVLTEARSCLSVAEVDVASAAEDELRRRPLLQTHAVSPRQRPGNSSWQSLARETGDIETPFLNGEIALLGRLNGVLTPVNDLLQRVALELAQCISGPQRWTTDRFLRHISVGSGG